MLDGLFGLLYYGWSAIGDLIGGPATYILASLLGLGFVRIVISFIIRFFKFQDNYHMSRAKWKADNTSNRTLFDVNDLPKVD